MRRIFPWNALKRNYNLVPQVPHCALRGPMPDSVKAAHMPSREKGQRPLRSKAATPKERRSAPLQRKENEGWLARIIPFPL